VSDAPPAPPPSLEEVRAWIGSELDDSAGAPLGRIDGAYLDAQSGEPVWLVVSAGRRRRARTTVVPLRECAALPARAWTAQRRDAVLGAPTVDPSRPLLREHEVAICAHYEIDEATGRHAEVASREPASVTAEP
jgi:hypothetical protein